MSPPVEPRGFPDWVDALIDLDPAERASGLDALRAHDPTLAARVERALRRAEDRGGYLDAGAEPTIEPPHDAAAGAVIDDWRLIRRIGVGGMGEVWLAERAVGDFAQSVAIKRVRVDVRASRERFALERRILAGLDHPGIARLLDGGIGPDDRPYMVMELVEGRTLLEWCVQHRADLSQRLGLFLQVCDAVAYAHSRLVVHRDLKPGNIMVTDDGRVKLLDFGVAKLIGDDALPAATQTRAMSPDYAAPEQFSGAPIGTATDVFALGATLYQLLTGRMPWAQGDSPLSQALQRTRPMQSPPPSRAAASDGPIEPAALLGDLDAIVLKAIRFEVSDRYTDARALADDLRRHLQHHPVEARQRAWSYVARRFLRRHRVALAGSAALLAVAVAGAYTTLRESHKAAVAADRAREINAFLIGVFEGSDPDLNRGGMPSARDLLERGRERLSDPATPPVLRAELASVLGQLYTRLGEFAPAEALLRESLGGPPSSVDDARRRGVALAEALRAQGKAREALEAFDAALLGKPPSLDEALLRARIRFEATNERAAVDELAVLAAAQSEPADRARAELLHAELLALSDRDREALPLLERAYADARAAHGDDDLATARIGLTLTNALGDTQDTARSVQIGTEVLATFERRLGPAHPRTVEALYALAEAAMGDGALQRAAGLYETVIARAGDRAAPDEATRFSAYGNLAFVRYELRDVPRALAAYDQAIDLGRRLYGGDDPRVLSMQTSRAFVRFRSGRRQDGMRDLEETLATWRGREDRARFISYADTLRAAATTARSGPDGRGADDALLQESIDVATALQGPDHPHPNQTRVLLGRSRLQRGDAAGALAAFDATIVVFRRTFPDGHVDLARTLTYASEAALALGRPALAVDHAREAAGFLDREFADVPARRFEAHARLALALDATGKSDEARVAVEDFDAASIRDSGAPAELIEAIAALRSAASRRGAQSP
jgi:tetratricopeptide (TPR) repeat protein